MSESGLLRNTHHTDPQKRLFRPWTSAAADVCPNTERGKIIPKVHAYFPRIFPRKTLLSPRGWYGAKSPEKTDPTPTRQDRNTERTIFCRPDFWAHSRGETYSKFLSILKSFYLFISMGTKNDRIRLPYIILHISAHHIAFFCSRGKSRFLSNFEKARKTLKPCEISVGYYLEKK